MCGIVGYFGPREPKTVILDGLKKLEYRGYDSAGLAIFDKVHFKTVRAEGKLKELEAKLQRETFAGRTGIGHTRWATHGVPSERNAHPHSVDGVCLIANGIVENYLQIREELLARKRDIKSDTDSELIAHLVAEELRHTPNLRTAVEKVYPKLQGAFAVLIVWDKEPDTIVALKNGPPLVVGIGEREIVIASDVQAIVPYTKKVVYLEDGEMAIAKGSHIEFFKSGNAIQKSTTEITWSAALAEKAGYKHFMLKEIFEQPRAVAQAMEPHINLENKSVVLDGISPDQLEILTQTERLVIVACGTGYYSGLVGEYLIEKLAHIPVEVELASEFRYRHPVFTKNTTVLVISQSGETADTLAALKLAKEKKVPVVSICNAPHSTIDRESDISFYMNSGPEIAVASTKAFTGTLAFLNILAIAMGRAKNRIDAETESNLIEKMQLVPSLMEGVLSYNTFFAQTAHSLKSHKGFLYIGRGVSYPIALEGALKLKELAYMHAEGYSAGEMKHGPIALIDREMAVVVVAPKDDVFEKTISNLEEVRARGGRVITISTGENPRLADLSEHYLSLPVAEWSSNPLLAVIPLQLLAYHVADALGFDVDQPRNLAKSVTVE